jgi:hypothetical protein
MNLSRWKPFSGGLIIFIAASFAGAQTFFPPTVKKTVGTSASSCGASSQITVLRGTNVYFCYTITNPNDFPIDYNLTDNVLGVIGSGFVDALDSDTFDGILENVNQTVTNTASWGYTTEEINATSPALAAAARLRSSPAVTGVVEDSATVNVANALVPTLTDAGMLLFGIAIAGCALLLLRRAA